MKCHCENLALGSTGSIHVARIARLNFILRLFILRLIGDAFVKKNMAFKSYFCRRFHSLVQLLVSEIIAIERYYLLKDS